MAKYMVLYSSTNDARELMAQASAEEMQASMQEWIRWKESLAASIGFEWGLPLQADSEITPTAVQASHSTVSGYATMEGEKDAITEALKTHPHLKRDGASIDMLEMLTMPGM
ncbi:MAG: hypothetical protein V4490_07715 [Pseudomonadota bacterium]